MSNWFVPETRDGHVMSDLNSFDINFVHVLKIYDTQVLDTLVYGHVIQSG